MPGPDAGTLSGVPELILASGSPRRRELLALLGLSFRVQVSGEAEDSAETDPAKLALELARAKGRAVARLHPAAAVVAADTVVAVGDTLLGKPADVAENEAFLRLLSGTTHRVCTGVAVVSPAGEYAEVACTDVTFRALSDAEMRYYADSGEGLDKAGGYGIQGLGMALVRRIEGEYSTVVGFPLSVVVRLLRGVGLPVWNEAGRPMEAWPA